MNKLKAVIFDLDGVITNTAEYHYLAWNKLAEELGIPFSRAQNEQLKGISRYEALEIFLMNGKKEFTDFEKEELASRKNKYYLQFIQSLTPDDILPGIRTFIKDLKERGYKLGLASASKNAFLVMERLRLNKDFDYMVDASLVKNGKPDPEIFLTAAGNLQVKPEECIGIEDAVSGVEAIKAAGMFAVAIGEPSLFPHSHITFKSTEELSLEKLKKHFITH